MREMDLASRTGPRIPVIIDCDPGHDDAIALMLAFGCGRLNVLGVTTVAGNTTGENALRNALAVLSLIRAAVPVGRGADSPMLRPRTAGRSRQERSREGSLAPRRTQKVRSHGSGVLSSALRQSPVR